jgi:SpoVK/Ycf46/Vps4 family AAA+-type ATPase
MEVGNPIYENMKGVWTVQEGHELPFDDKIHGVRGKIIVRGIEKTKDNPESKPLKCIELYIDSSCNITANKYIKNLDKYFESYLEKNVPLKLYMIKVFRTAGGMQNLTSIMYRGNRNTTEERYNHYMMSYFSENREKIWNIVKTIQFKPENFQRFGQEPRVNMIFHGPPGTGKSSFVHRLAVCLGRHVVCLDLKSFSESKFSLYATLRKLNVENSSYEPHQYIILFEEFDIGFFHLLDKKKVEKKDPRADPSNSLEIEDLLELLQGPVPIPGGIIIATTNKYEEMSQIMPAMFRPGRLTPVFFGKMTWDSLQEMSMHYFNRQLDIPRMDIDVSSAEIVETAISLSIQSTGKSFELFEDFIKKRVKIV